jgi:lipopolysaccharide/colanic/teichoic acid biosynthesis glycosyltransferase
MSLVGPRPPSIDEYRQFTLEHLRKLEVIPGITGLWQVTARSDPSFQSYIRCDLEYIEHWSLWLDIEILMRTSFEVLRGTGV